MNLTNNNYDSKANRFSTEYISNQNIKTNPGQSSDSVASVKPSSQDLTTLLQKGTNFQGTITDIRQNEVNIQLKDGSNLTAKIANPTSLQIGQTADFKVVYQSEKSIGIEIVSNPNEDSVEPTVVKALEGANLPINNKNQLIVKELLDNNMSVDKQTLLNILRDSYKHPDVSINTLVSLNKYNIPLTDQNIAQFDQYKNMEHRIMSGVSTISNELPNIIDELLNSGSNEDILDFHTELSNLLTNKEILGTGNGTIPYDTTSTVSNMINEKPDNLPFININWDTLNMNELKEVLFSSSNIYMSGDISTNSLTLEDRKLLLEMLNPEQISQEDKSSLLNGTLDFRSVFSLLKDSSQNLTTTEPYNKEQNNLLLKLADCMQLYQKEQGDLSSILSNDERTTLYSELQKFPLSEELKQSVLNGSISGNDFIQSMQTYISSDSSSKANEVLKLGGYQKILKEMLESKWSLTPKSLTEDSSVENLYKTLQNDLDEMSRLLEHTKVNIDTIFHNVNNLKENLDFMKTINEMYTYVQLPVKLRNQNLHSDLYIYTNKKELKDKKDNISVLLHLDMDHLGPTDIHLTLYHSKVVAKFYMSDEESKQLIESNLDLLETALENKGYSISSEVNFREKEANLVDDLLSQNNQTANIKRYSFDIRT